jgi:hypothetical protein
MLLLPPGSKRHILPVAIVELKDGCITFGPNVVASPKV